jgi:hypothetical protein
MKFVQGISVFVLAASGLIAQTVTPPTPVQAVGTTGIVGITEGQFARFNVLNPGVLPPAVGVVCNALLTFLGPDGGVLKTKLVTVTPGQSAYLDLFSDVDLALAVGVRKEIRATFTTPPVIPVASSTTPVAAPCKLIATLEIIDALSLKTQVLAGGMHAVPGSTPLE